jgi:hypothetical protein
MSEKPTRRLGEATEAEYDATWHHNMDCPIAEERALAATRERARRRGASEDLIEQMYGKPRSKEELERALEERRERARAFGWTEKSIEDMYGKPPATRAK